jgi:hypothetical protein
MLINLVELIYLSIFTVQRKGNPFTVGNSDISFKNKVDNS